MPREMPEVTKINAPNPAHLRAVTLPVPEDTITPLPIGNVLLCISARGENFFPSFTWMATQSPYNRTNRSLISKK